MFVGRIPAIGCGLVAMLISCWSILSRRTRSQASRLCLPSSKLYPELSLQFAHGLGSMFARAHQAWFDFWVSIVSAPSQSTLLQTTRNFPWVHKTGQFRHPTLRLCGACAFFCRLVAVLWYRLAESYPTHIPGASGFVMVQTSIVVPSEEGRRTLLVWS